MPIIHQKEGTDLLESPCDILVDLNNTIGVSGGGVALAFKMALPDHYRAYRDLCETTLPKPGMCLVATWRTLPGSGVRVPRTVCMFTKGRNLANPTKESWVRESLLGLRRILNLTNERTNPHQVLSCALAHPGCGLGGLSKEDIGPMVQEILGNLPNEIHLY